MGKNANSCFVKRVIGHDKFCYSLVILLQQVLGCMCVCVLDGSGLEDGLVMTLERRLIVKP